MEEDLKGLKVDQDTGTDINTGATIKGKKDDKDKDPLIPIETPISIPRGLLIHIASILRHKNKGKIQIFIKIDIDTWNNEVY